MRDGILARLVSYSPNPAKRQLENFLTEVFAFIVQRHPEILDQALVVARRRGRLRRIPRSLALVQRLEVQTQVAFEKPFGRPDMLVIADGQQILVIENKLDAGFTQCEVGPEESKSSGGDAVPGKVITQLEKYVGLVANRGWAAEVLLLSTGPRDIPVTVWESPAYLGNMLWRDVFEAIAKFQEGSSDVLVGEVLLLMEELRMKAPNPIYPCEASIYHDYTALQRRATELVDRVADAVASKYRLQKTKGYCTGNYAHRLLAGELVSLYVCFFFADSEPTQQPSLLAMAVADGSEKAAEARQALNCTEQRDGWGNNRFTYMTSAQKKRLIGQLEWEEQVKAAAEIACEWMEALVSSGIIERIP